MHPYILRYRGYSELVHYVRNYSHVLLYMYAALPTQGLSSRHPRRCSLLRRPPPRSHTI